MKEKRMKQKRLLFPILAFALLMSLVACKITNTNQASDYAYILEKGEDVRAEILPVKNGAKAIYTLISDDGVYESGVILNELSHKYNLRTTVSGIVDYISEYLEQWKQIEKEGYVDLVSHSYSHKKINNEENVTSEEIYHEVVDAKKYYEKHFPGSEIVFVAPENCVSDEERQVLLENDFRAVRLGERGLNPLSPEYTAEPFQWYNLGVRGIGDVKTTQERNAWVDAAIEEKKWLIEMWHIISPTGVESYQPISTKMAEEHLAYVANLKDANEIWVASYLDAVKYIQERQNSELITKQVGDQIAVAINYKDEMPSQFNMPLTVKIEVPESWGGVTVWQNDVTSFAPTQYNSQSKESYVLVDVLPNNAKTILGKELSMEPKTHTDSNELTEANEQVYLYETENMILESEDDAYRYTRVYNYLEPSKTYALKVEGAKTPYEDHPFFTVRVFDFDAKKMVLEHKMISNSSDDQIWEFTVPVNVNNIALIIYSGEVGYCEKTRLELEYITLKEIKE